MEELIRITMERRLNDMSQQIERLRKELENLVNPKFRVGDIVVTTVYEPVYPVRLVFEVVNITDIYLSGEKTRMYFKSNCELATDGEALEYLKAEAITKGLVQGIYYQPLNNNSTFSKQILRGSFYLSKDGLQDLLCAGFLLRSRKEGWAKVVSSSDTYTFSRAQLEKYLVDLNDFFRTSTEVSVLKIINQFINLH
jgi:hypothetical protein